MSKFQQTVSKSLGFGIAGEASYSSPIRANSFRIVSPDPTHNVFGRAFTFNTDGTVRAGGTGAFAGILINPKNQALYPTADDPFGTNNSLANNTEAEFMNMGIIYVDTGDAAGAVGAAVNFNTTTGVIAFGAPAAGQAVVPNSKLFPEASAGGITTIQLTN